MNETIQENLMRNFYGHPTVKESIKKLEGQVVEGKLSPFIAARDLLESYKSGS